MQDAGGSAGGVRCAHYDSLPGTSTSDARWPAAAGRTESGPTAVKASPRGLRPAASRSLWLGMLASGTPAPLPHRQHPRQQLPDAPPQGPLQGHSSDGFEGSGRRTGADEADVMRAQRVNAPAPAPVAPLPPRGPGRGVPFSMPRSVPFSMPIGNPTELSWGIRQLAANSPRRAASSSGSAYGRSAPRRGLTHPVSSMDPGTRGESGCAACRETMLAGASAAVLGFR